MKTKIEKKIEKIYYWDDEGNKNKIKIQIHYNIGPIITRSSDIKELKEIEHNNNIKAIKVH